MTGQIFLRILNMSYTASYVIIFVMMARLFLKIAPKIFSYLLWGVVLFRLICSFSFSSIWSMMPENSLSLPLDANDSEITLINTGITTVDHTNPSAPPVNVLTDGINTLQGKIALGEVIWLIGIAALLLYSIVSLLRLHWKLIGSVKLRANIYLADHINSPFVMGIIRPRIYLPSSLSVQDRNYIILHEQTHIRRLDHIVKILAFAVLTLHWFNPLVWVAFVLFGNDMEMSCDESVMKHMNSDIRGDYSALLLGMATGRNLIAGVPLAFCEGDIKGRIKNVMTYKKPAFWVIVVSLVAVITVATSLVSNPHENKASMQWAKRLDIQDVEKIELIESPGLESDNIRPLDASEFEDIIALMNESSGNYIKNPEELAGGSITFEITLTDGTRHKVSNAANRYLIIDGDYYDVSYQWLSSWEKISAISASPTAMPSVIPSVIPQVTPSVLRISSYSGNRLTFDYPSDWTMKENPTEDSAYVNFYSSASEEEPAFWYSRGEAWLTDFNRTKEDYQILLSESYKELDITELDKTTIDGYDALKLVFTYSLKDTKYVMTQYEIVAGYVSYQFNYTYPAESSTESEGKLKVIISSVKFTQTSEDKTSSSDTDKNSDHPDHSRKED